MVTAVVATVDSATEVGGSGRGVGDAVLSRLDSAGGSGTGTGVDVVESPKAERSIAKAMLRPSVNSQRFALLMSMAVLNPIMRLRYVSCQCRLDSSNRIHRVV